MVHPAYYAFQVVYVVWASILLGFFIIQLQHEVRAEGWKLTPRTMFLELLCVSSSIFLLGHLDPRGFLGIYSPPVMKFIELFAIICMLQSCGAVLYVYLIVTFQQNLTRVPKRLRSIWRGFHCAFFVCEIVSILTMAISDRYFWSGVNISFLASHEIALVLVLNVSLCRLSRGLNKLNNDKTLTLASFDGALRKIYIVQSASCLLATLTILYQLAPGGGVERLKNWEERIPQYPSNDFSIISLASPTLVCCCHSICLFISRRPSTKPTRKNFLSELSRQSSTPESPKHSDQSHDRSSQFYARPSTQEADESRPKLELKGVSVAADVLCKQPHSVDVSN